MGATPVALGRAVPVDGDAGLDGTGNGLPLSG